LDLIVQYCAVLYACRYCQVGNAVSGPPGHGPRVPAIGSSLSSTGTSRVHARWTAGTGHPSRHPPGASSPSDGPYASLGEVVYPGLKEGQAWDERTECPERSQSTNLPSGRRCTRGSGEGRPGGDHRGVAQCSLSFRHLQAPRDHSTPARHQQSSWQKHPPREKDTPMVPATRSDTWKSPGRRQSLWALNTPHYTPLPSSIIPKLRHSPGTNMSLMYRKSSGRLLLLFGSQLEPL